jgi:hypothetical protein
MSRLAICAIFRHEDPYLDEWVRFHRAQGFERFFLYDNGTDGERLKSSSILAPYSEATHIHFPGRSMQLRAYANCLARFGSQADWIAFIDLDEFLFRASPGTLKSFLETFERQGCGAVAVNWMMFGSSGHETLPPGGVLQNLTKRARESHPENRHVKAIVRPSFVISSPQNPHFFPLKAPALDESGRRVVGPFNSPPRHEHLRINHYCARSAAGARLKCKYQRADTGTIRDPSLLHGLYLNPALNEVEDRTILARVVG